MDYGFNHANLTPGVVAETSAATINIDSLAGTTHTWVAGHDATINFSGDGAFVFLIPTCDASVRTLTWGTGVHGAAASYALTANKKHSLYFVYDGTEHVLTSVTVLS